MKRRRGRSVSFYLPYDLIELLSVYSEETNMSYSEIVAKALRSYFQRRKLRSSSAESSVDVNTLIVDLRKAGKDWNEIKERLKRMGYNLSKSEIKRIYKRSVSS